MHGTEKTLGNEWKKDGEEEIIPRVYKVRLVGADKSHFSSLVPV